MESQVIRTYLETIAELPWNARSRRAPRRAGSGADPRRGPLRPDDVKDRVLEFLAVRQLPQRDARRRGGRGRRESRTGAGDRGRSDEGRRPQRRRARAGTDPALRRPAGRRQDLDRQVDRPRDGTQVRPHLARRRARRGRHPRPPPHLHRRHARTHPPGHEAGRHARTRSSCSTRSTSSASRSRATRRRRCSRCSTRRRTTASRTTTWRCRSTSPRSSSSPPPTSSRTSRGRCSTAWRSATFAGYTEGEKLEIAQQLPRAAAARGERPRRGPARARPTAPSLEVDHRATRASPACASSSASSAAGAQGGAPDRGRARSRRTTLEAGGRPRAPRPAAGPPREDGRARTRSASRPACTTRRPAATSCSSRPRPCAARAS